MDNVNNLLNMVLGLLPRQSTISNNSRRTASGGYITGRPEDINLTYAQSTPQFANDSASPQPIKSTPQQFVELSFFLI